MTGSRVLGIACLVFLSLFFCWAALRAPFFGGMDLPSNLMPIIHYRHSILHDHRLPLYTELWYGGRRQWENPLWSFFYLPATIVWLLLPLQWGARVVVAGHFLAAALAGRLLAARAVRHEAERVLAAVLFLSPIAPALALGHLEKIMAWPWVLGGLGALIGDARNAWRRGITAGICLGVVGLAGADYYLLYAIILFGVTALLSTPRSLSGLALGSLIGLLHVPSIWNLIGRPRSVLAESIPTWSLSVRDVWRVLFSGPTEGALRSESFAVIGAPMVVVLMGCVLLPLIAGRLRPAERRRVLALLASAAVFLGLATGALYRGHHWLVTFRVPSRAMAFAAVSLVVASLIGATRVAYRSRLHLATWIVLLTGAACSSLSAWWQFRPTGSTWIDDSGAQALARYLKQNGARSVWMNAEEPEHVLLNVALNLEGIALPNVYYGQMNQSIPVRGPYCGYSFDFLLAGRTNEQTSSRPLISDVFPRRVLGSISRSELKRVRQFEALGRNWTVYKVICRDVHKASPARKSFAAAPVDPPFLRFASPKSRILRP